MWLKRLWSQIEEDLGYNDDRMNRDRPYSGQPHTDGGTRGMTEINGITFRDLRDCFVRAVALSSGDQLDGRLYREADKGPNGLLSENDLYNLNLNRIDIMAVSQNLSCEIERVMGIFPNVPRLIETDKTHG